MSEPVNQIALVDVRIPFWRLVLVLLKLALAAIPATILFVLVVGIATVILRVIGLGLLATTGGG